MMARFIFCRHSRSRFQSDGVLSRLRFDHQRDFVFGGGIVGFDGGNRFRLFGFGFGFAARVMSRCTDLILKSVQAIKLRRECGRAGVRSRDTEWIRSNAMK